MVKGYTLNQIMEIVWAANSEAAKSIFTARKLQSGDILLTTIMVKAREELERKGLKTNTLTSSARVLR